MHRHPACIINRFDSWHAYLGGTFVRMKTAHSAAAGLLGLLLMASPASLKAADDIKLLPVGQAAPMFEAVDLDGNPFSLKEELTRGPVFLVFLVFWSIF